MKAILAGGVAALALGTASAQDVVAPDGRATWTVAIENDGYFGEDDNYTSGLRLGYLSGNERLGRTGRFVAQRVLGLNGDPSKMRWRRGFSIAQEIYTPRDLEASALLPDQHPYGAYLYGEYTSLVEQPGRVDQISVQMGVVGPQALGEETQDFTHSITGREKSNGWDNQIDTAVGLNVTYDQQRRIAHSGLGILGMGWDCVWNMGFSAGTVKTAGRVGGNIRIGENLTNGFGPPRVRPSTAGSGFFTPKDRRSWYIFAGGQVEAVAHNIFLDNSLFRDSGPSVERRVIVGDTQGGVALQMGSAQVTFTYVLRTREFEAQQDSQKFGALSISRRF
ncbi:lipid A deacylase LpxR family protein [Parvularcula sp. ZS-1/3]|uniref:Lipid A deacylase LpxR family protein n=1 Tax=Parvularcula mediterranea TaxID=2732508 RepID=A0A7Y3RPY5_9PROT|nr:lipid A deacylase LpxR family protein [Parvularcula mediterranea]